MVASIGLPEGGFILLGLIVAFSCAVLMVLLISEANLSFLLIASTFVTRLRFDVFGAGIRLEHVFALLLLSKILVFPAKQRCRSEVFFRTTSLVVSYVIWCGFISVMNSPDVASSLRIVGWLTLDLLIFIACCRSSVPTDRILTWGIQLCGLASVVAIAMWVLATATGSTAGVQVETLTGGRAVYGLSYEANILGSTLGLWVLIALMNAGSVTARARQFVVSVGTLAILLTLTRAAAVGVAVGALLWLMLTSASSRRLAVKIGSAGAVLLIVAAPLLETASVFEKGSELLNFGSSTGKYRVDSWQTAIDDLGSRELLIGLGSNSFGQRHLDPSLPTDPTPGYLANLPLQLVYDSGVIGAVLLGLATATAMGGTLRKRAPAIGLLCAYLIFSIATSLLWFGTTWILLAIAVRIRSAESLQTMDFEEV